MLPEILDSINQSKQNLFNGIPTKEYDPFIIGRAFSYYEDTAQLANELNMFPDIQKNMHYDFLLNVVRKRKRFSKWAKAEKPSELTLAIMQLWGYNRRRSEDCQALLSDTQKQEILNSMTKGGKQ